MLTEERMEQSSKNMTPGERIRLIREKNGMNQAAFAKEISISTTSVCQLEVGKYNISRTTKHILCHRFNINPEWLDTGEGEMYAAPESVVNVVSDLTQILNNNQALLNIAKRAIRKLSPDEWSKMNTLVSLLVKTE